MPYESLANYLTHPSLSAQDVQNLTIYTLAKLNGFAFFPFAAPPTETKDYSQQWPSVLHTFFLALSSTYLLKLIDEELSQSEEKKPKKASLPVKVQQEKKGKASSSRKVSGSLFYCILLIIALFYNL